MGLRFPTDLDAWERWHARRHLARTVKGRVRTRLRPPAAPQWSLVRGSADADILIALDSAGPTTQLALLRPLQHLDPARVAVLAPFDPTSLLPERPQDAPAPAQVTPGNLRDALAGVRVVLSGGSYLPVGQAVYAATDPGVVPYVVAQHGLMTPLAPPLAPGAHLLAWSEQDADFWRSGRRDITTEVVGSQLFFEASTRPAADVDPDARPTFLGQLHGAELPRHQLVSATYRFCRDHEARYRPHPSERDRASRGLHRLWARQGIAFDPGTTPLAQLTDPVVSIFSTGVLEAAARGVPAWVAFPDPPAWLAEFWERYGMRRYGEEPTPAPVRAAREPMATVARRLVELSGRAS